MASVQALAGVANSPVASPFARGVAQRAYDRFGPATIVGQKAPPTVFVVYTARGSFSGGGHVTASSGVIPSVGDYLKASRSAPIQRPTRTSQGYANIPDQVAYNRQGQLVNQVTLFQSGHNYQYSTGQRLLI